MVLSSDEETESDDAGPGPRKMCNTVSMPKLLRDIGDVLGNKFYLPRQKEIVVGPSSLKASHSPFTGSLLVDPGSYFVLGGALGMSGDSSPSDKPSMVDKMRTASHTLDFEAYVQAGWLLKIPYCRKTSPPMSGVVLSIHRPQ
ncbi:unnamed protein product [Lactuca saligna]|uniref:Uncharacterized protein n=1 Tax=Lactuca saligna TaxID=75948 RepID=A0AA36EJF5_LACSI|nr:unnamed protein product [Lactuca saligna]